MGVRVGDSVVYVTDTTVLQTTETFAHGAELLLHETWLTDAEAARDEAERSRHSCFSDVAAIAKRAGAARLMPIHHSPWRSDAEIRRLTLDLEDLGGMEVLVPEEGRSYELE